MSWSEGGDGREDDWTYLLSICRLEQLREELEACEKENLHSLNLLKRLHLYEISKGREEDVPWCWLLVVAVDSDDDVMGGLDLDLPIYPPFKTVPKNNTLAHSCGSWTSKLFKATAMSFGRDQMSDNAHSKNMAMPIHNYSNNLFSGTSS